MTTIADSSAFAFDAGPVGCLLLHGFSGTPYEMRYLGERLRESGFTAHGPRLAGHATEGSELLRSDARDWYASARSAFETLRRQCDAVVVVGLSMGALLAVRLAAEHPQVITGIALLAPAIAVRDRRLQRYAPLLRLLLPIIPAPWQQRPKLGSDILDPEARAVHPRFPVSLRGMVELAALQQHVRPLLRRVQQPALILHGQRDRICPVENADLVRRELGSREVRVRVLEHSAHVLTVDAEKDVVAEEVATFVRSVSTVRHRGAPDLDAAR